jgi:5-methylcytosine-specific restriction endonuclease McrA
MNAIHKTTVLVLNRCWQAIHVKTPAEAFSMMATGTATALDIDEEGQMNPVRWEQWLLLPVRPTDASIGTVRGHVRVPTVIVLARFAKVPKRKPGFSARAIWDRDGGICQYTGRRLKPGEGNIDHVIPRSRGGGNTWQNCVLADKRINSRKGSKLPQEAGLRLIRVPTEPREMPTTRLIRNAHQVRDWELFLEKE